MRILAFSDLHCDLETAASLVAQSRDADVVVGAGDYANEHHGLEPTIRALAAIETPTILIPGNNETEDELRGAVDAAGWDATVLHGESAEIDGTTFFGLGAGIPTTPWGWSFDLTEEEAAERLAPCPDGAVLVVHSPPKDHCDSSSQGLHLGSTAILDGDRGQAAAAGGLRPHPRELGRAIGGRPNPNRQPRSPRDRVRGLGGQR